MFGLVEAGQELAGDAGEDAILGFEHGDALARLGENGRGFEADVAAADDDGAGGDRKLVAHPVRVGAGADGVDAGEVVAVAEAAGGAARMAALAERDRGLRAGGNAASAPEEARRLAAAGPTSVRRVRRAPRVRRG